MTLDAATREYIKKHFRIEDGKLYRIKKHSLNNPSTFNINGKFILKRKVFKYLETGKWDDEPLNNTSGSIGISYCSCSRGKKWLARLTRNNHIILNKYYNTKEEAIEAYNKALDEYNSKQMKEEK